MKKIYLVTGGKGSGKSTAIARFPPPDEIGKMCVFDCEDSLSDIVENNKKMGVEFGAHIRVYERFKANEDLLGQIAKGQLPWVSKEHKNALLDYYDYFITTLDKTLKQGQFKYFGLDTVETIEAAMAVWVEKNREKAGWSGNRAYGRMEVEGVRPLYENLLEAIGRRGVEHIILTSHLKAVWEGEGQNVKKILNKVQAGGRISLLSRISTAMFWLMPSAGNADGAPAAVVLKARMGKEKIVGNKWVTERPLPQRIPHFTWDDVWRYREQGCDWKNPKSEEVMTEEEKQVVSEFLTDEQMRLMVLGAEIDLEQAKAQQLPSLVSEGLWTGPSENLKEQVQALKAAGKGNGEIAQELGMSMVEVIKALKDSGGVR